MKKIAIICSTTDPAGMNMKDALISGYSFEPAGIEFDGIQVMKYTGACSVEVLLYTTTQETIYMEKVDEQLECDCIIYATKHESKNQVHSLTCHTPGNWGDAMLGGKPKTLCVAPAHLLTHCHRDQVSRAQSEGLSEQFEITTECTHHGPELSVPTMFIEIGSALDQWKDANAGRLNAATIIHLLENCIDSKNEMQVAIGIGGLHHCHNFIKLMQGGTVAIGHVIPKYALEHLDVAILTQAIEKTYEDVDVILVDWKGLGPHKERVKAVCDEVAEKAGVPWIKIKDFKKQPENI